MCNLIAFALGGLLAGIFSKGAGRPILKQTVKGGILAKRKAEEVGQRVKSGFNDLVADARSELDPEVDYGEKTTRR
ncbi:MAG TPA: hypothetical protein VIX89_20665 [Bryobacteraceae bacterium]